MNENLSSKGVVIDPLVSKEFQRLSSKIDSLVDKNRRLYSRIQDEKRAREQLERQEVHLANMLGKRLPFRQQINIPLPGGTESPVTGKTHVSRDGPFVCRRIYASLVVTSARVITFPISGEVYDYNLFIGRFVPVTSSSEYKIWGESVTGAGRFVDPPLDFDWKYFDSGSGRNRENKLISGDVLARRDDDGYLMNNEVFAAGSDINFTVFPTKQTGGPIFTFFQSENETWFMDLELKITFDGFKILQPLEM